MPLPMRLIPTLTLFALAGALCACESPDARSSRPRMGAPSNPSYNPGPFAAVELRIHPLTRVTPAPPNAEVPGPQIEAHLELLDSFGLPVRDTGLLRFELFQGLPGVDPDAAPASALQDSVWNLDLTDPARSARQFDHITQTYVIPLPGAPEWLFDNAPATLRVELTTPDGRRLVATRRLNPQ